MTDRIIGAGNTVQLLISQKGVQAMITLMVIATVLFMTLRGMDVPDWLFGLMWGFTGLYFEVPAKVARANSV